MKVPWTAIASSATVGSVIAAAVGVWFLQAQLRQANEHQRWGNYNAMNARYSDLYGHIPPQLHYSQCKQLSELPPDAVQWIRSYLDLYSEEHWLFLQGLIPKEMWTERIDRGVDVNLTTYPLLSDGYAYWKSRGSFNHPKEFIPLVDDKIAKLKRKIEDSRRSGCEQPRHTAELGERPAPSGVAAPSRNSRSLQQRGAAR